MKLIASIIFAIALLSSPLKKRVLPYTIVAGSADLIVEGTIDHIYDSQIVDGYQLKIDTYLKTNTKKDKITIKNFKEWTCDHRSQEVTLNQRVLLFLKEGGNGFYEIINGSTGEIIIDDNIAIRVLRQEYAYDEFKNGIRAFVQAYEYNGPLYPSYNEKPVFNSLIDLSKIENLKKENPFFKTLTEKIESNY